MMVCLFNPVLMSWMLPPCWVKFVQTMHARWRRAPRALNWFQCLCVRCHKSEEGGTEFSHITVMCLSSGTPKNNEFSICPKWKIYYF